jgi:GH24 family phage-related lysozyme (muramidase)
MANRRDAGYGVRNAQGAFAQSADFEIEDGVLVKYRGNAAAMVIPAGVTTIGDWAFLGCSSLASVTIPAGVTSIGVGAFYGCSGLVSVTIPEGVTSIGRGTFSGCPSLVSVTIPASVAGIGVGAFSGCSHLASVTIPAGVTRIGEGAFRHCSSLTAISVSSENRQYKDADGVLFSKDGKTLIHYPAGNTQTAYAIPVGVTTIGMDAFAVCIGLVSVTIPAGVTTIGEAAFAGCTGLKPEIRAAIESGSGQAFLSEGKDTEYNAGMSGPTLCVDPLYAALGYEL